MRILAIETVEKTGSVAALERDRTIAQRQLDAQRRIARSLAPSIADLLAEVRWQPADVQLVAVAVGPGSFTGLRIGVTTAKTFAYAAGCQVIGVPTLAAIAARSGGDVSPFWVVLNAQRNELFAAEFARDDDGQLGEVTPTHIVAADAWLTSLAAGSIVTGPGLERIFDRLPSGVRPLERSLWAPTAEAVGKLGWSLYEAGQRSTPFDLVPLYVRGAAAEEKRHPEGPADQTGRAG